MAKDHSTFHLKAISAWLLVCCASIFAMIIIGAITRLTESGLSMVEWKPLIGAIPPLNEAEWNRVFDLYKQSPEFQKKNFWMGLEDFKNIFFWEWLHRLWGRMIGVLYALPFLFFAVKGWIPQGYRLKLFGIFILGGLQGFMGWYMVKSGLVDQPAVSHYRLAAHLMLAFLIYGCIFWVWLGLKHKIQNSNAQFSLRLHGWVCLLMAVGTMIWGAFTAGLDAGLVYNDAFPKMGKTWIPSEIWFHQPLWLNFFENHAGVQFVHRWMAMTTAILVLAFSLHAFYTGHKQSCFALLGAFVFIQLALGIFTLFSGVNIVIAVLHQAGAVFLLTLLLWCLHTFKPHGVPAH